MSIAGYRLIFLSLVVTVVFLQGICYAGMEEEISHLLLFIEKSECTFVRNDKQYSAANARQHIERKYNYLKKRINTTDQFIQYSATKSSMSGKPYTVQCKSKVMNTSEWLYEELDKFRAR